MHFIQLLRPPRLIRPTHCLAHSCIAPIQRIQEYSPGIFSGTGRRGQFLYRIHEAGTSRAGYGGGGGWEGGGPWPPERTEHKGGGGGGCSAAHSSQLRIHGKQNAMPHEPAGCATRPPPFYSPGAPSEPQLSRGACSSDIPYGLDGRPVKRRGSEFLEVLHLLTSI
jgi:hypothetical protein